MRWSLTSWEIRNPRHYQWQKMQCCIFQYWNFHSGTLVIRARGKYGLLCCRRVCGVSMLDFFSPEWSGGEGRGFHDIDIQSTTWTVNADVLRLLHRRRLTKQHLKTARSFPGFLLLLAYHCQRDFIFTCLYLNPILMFCCCSYNVNTHTVWPMFCCMWSWDRPMYSSYVDQTPNIIHANTVLICSLW